MENTILTYVICLLCMMLCVMAWIIYCQMIRLRNDIKKISQNTAHVDTGQDWQKVYDAYSEEHQVAEWIRLRLEDKETDISSLINGANNRSLALAVKLAEDNVNSAANTVKRVQQKTNQARNHLISLSSHEPYNTAEKVKAEKIIEALLKQEVEAMKNFEKAQEDLERLTTAIGEATPRPRPILTPEDIGG